MIENIIRDYLNDNATAPAYMQRPPEKPDGSYILLERIGGSRTDHIATMTLAVQSYAPTLYQAAELSAEVRDLLLDSMITLNEIASVRLESEINFTNTADKQPRYQAVFELTHY